MRLLWAFLPRESKRVSLVRRARRHDLAEQEEKLKWETQTNKSLGQLFLVFTAIAPAIVLLP